jgi:hypothetical protein
MILSSNAFRILGEKNKNPARRFDYLILSIVISELWTSTTKNRKSKKSQRCNDYHQIDYKRKQTEPTSVYHNWSHSQLRLVQSVGIDIVPNNRASSCYWEDWLVRTEESQLEIRKTDHCSTVISSQRKTSCGQQCCFACSTHSCWSPQIQHFDTNKLTSAI